MVSILETAMTDTWMTQVSLWYFDFAPLNKHNAQGM